MDYETVTSIVPPVGTPVGDTWTCELFQLGHPIEPVSFVSTSSGALVNYGGIINPTLAGANVEARSTAFLGLCNAWRMTYSSVTIDLDAAGLNDQGSVIAAQYPLAYTVLNCATSNNANPFATIFTHVVSADYASNRPGMQLGQLPGAFMGLAKDGVYMPLKLDPQADWANSECPVLVVPNAAQLPRGYALPNAAPVIGNCFPFFGEIAYQAACGIGCLGATAAWSNVLGTIQGSLVQPIQQLSIGTVVFYNLAATARLTIKVKWGVEMMVPAISALAPTMKPSAHLDTVALAAYSELNATLPWAYPSSYNVDNKLLSVVKTIWNEVRPAVGKTLGMIPHPYAQAGAAIVNALPSFAKFERPAGQGKAQQPQPKMIPAGNRGNGRGKKAKERGKRQPPYKGGWVHPEWS